MLESILVCLCDVLLQLRPSLLGVALVILNQVNNTLRYTYFHIFINPIKQLLRGCLNTSIVTEICILFYTGIGNFLPMPIPLKSADTADAD